LVERMRAGAEGFGKSVAYGIDFLRSSILELSGGELLEMAGKGLQVAFMSAVNFLARGIQAAMAAVEDEDFMSGFTRAVEDAALVFRSTMLKTMADVVQSLEGLPMMKERANVAAYRLRSGADLADAQREANAAEKGEVDAGALASAFLRHFESAKGVLSDEHLRADLRELSARVKARMETEKQKSSASDEPEFVGPPKPTGGAGGAKVQSGFETNVYQSAVNRLFGRGGEAFQKEANTLSREQLRVLGNMNSRLEGIERSLRATPMPPPTAVFGH
ncbi:MAG TPA: hypothetical protein PLA50_10465, partial [Bacteroidia bacterium]|nr:hypothetical protein [Bacteroidia bacterium]